MKKALFCILSMLFVVSSVFVNPASAMDCPPLTSAVISGYDGKICIQRQADDMPYKGDTDRLFLSSTVNQDISKLRVVWSAANPDEVRIDNKGYSKDTNQFEADVTYFKNDVTEPIYATVNGTKLEVYRSVSPDTDNTYSYMDNAGNHVYNESDTLGDFIVPQGKTYTFKITSSGKPSLVAGSKSFRYVSTAQSGSNYFITFRATGDAWEECGFYLNGGNLPVAIARIMQGTPILDTTGLVNVKKGQTYQFMVTCTSVPNFTIGSPCFRLVGSSHSGDRYFYKVKAVGNVGQASGIYLMKTTEIPEAVLKIV
jgi:hypothetical protein